MTKHFSPNISLIQFLYKVTVTCSFFGLTFFVSHPAFANITVTKLEKTPLSNLLSERGITLEAAPENVQPSIPTSPEKSENIQPSISTPRKI
jgi:hypothetical protein